MAIFARAAAKIFDQGIGTLASGGHIGQIINYRTVTGQTVNTEKALRYSPFYAAVRVLAESVASLPLIVYRRRTDGGKDRASDHSLYPILHDQPNPNMTSFTYRETGMAHLTTWGNGYSAIARDGRRRVRELWPLRPDRMDVKRIPGTTERRYRYQTTGETVELEESQVFHIPGLSWDGLVGQSVIWAARNAIAVGLAAEEYGGRFFENDATPGIALTHPKSLSDTARTNIETSWPDRHAGPANAGKFALLEEGMTIEQFGIPPDDAQFLQTRQFQVNEIARIFRIPPHMLGDLEHATFSNIEHSAIEFVVHTLRPWLVRWEQAIGAQLLGSDWTGAGGQYFVEFLVDALLRGDTKSRYEAYGLGMNAGFLNADMVQEAENRNPLPDGIGQRFFMPLSSAPANTYDENGMTGAQRANAVAALVRAGYDPAATLVAFNLPEITHTGFLPVTVQDEPLLGTETAGRSGPEPIITRAEVVAKKQELIAAGRDNGYGSLARELGVSEATIRRRLAEPPVQEVTA